MPGPPRSRRPGVLERRAGSRSGTAGCRSSTSPPAAPSRWSTTSSGLTAVFNGCIYDYQELRAELEGHGYRFFSTSDTEVILKGYHHWGTDVVSHLHGMFAFVIHERDTGRVVLARDRLGIKPLYLAETPGRLRFASTLPALLRAGDVDTSVDPVALHHYLTWHAVVPAPRTLLTGVRKLPPATVRVIEADGSSTEHRYWEPRYERRAEHAGWSARDWEDAIEEALRIAVRRRLVADIPVGVLLSGGLDSSLIVGLLAQEGQTRPGDLSASASSRSAAGRATSSPTPTSSPSTSAPTTTASGSAPTSWPARSGTRSARWPSPWSATTSSPSTCSASGSASRSRSCSPDRAPTRSSPATTGTRRWPASTARTRVGSYAARVLRPRRTPRCAPVVSDRYAARRATRAWSSSARTCPRPGAETAVDAALRLDSEIMLVDDPVKRVDNMSMAWGLEARVPFLDHDLVELAAACPPELKLADGGKGVLKAIGRRIIPPEVIDRPKGYFPVPAITHLEGKVLDLVRDALAGDAARDRGLFRPEYVRELLADPNGELTPLGGNKLWQLGLLELWLQTHAV